MTYTLEEITDIVKNYNYDRDTEAIILLTAQETSKEVTEENTSRAVKLGFAMMGDPELINKGLIAVLKDNHKVLDAFKLAVIDVLVANSLKESAEFIQSMKEQSGLSN